MTANPGTWSPSASFGYQWLRDGVVITGATQSTYVLVAADSGNVLTVRVRGARSGYTTLERLSTGTSPIAP